MPSKAKSAKSGATRRPQVIVLPKVQAASTKTVPTRVPARTRVNLGLCVLLALVTFLVYRQALQNPFVNFDDPRYVVENQNVHHGLSYPTLRWAFTTTEEANWHPVTWLSHAVDFQLFGLNPAGHHLTNVAFHLVNTILLFVILLRVTGAAGRSLVVAALFALHPFNVESVAWISERKNLLSMFFFLLSVGAYGWYARKPSLLRYSAIPVLFAVGLAAKPMGVTLPFVLLLLDFWPLQRVLGWGPPSTTFPVPQSSLRRLVLEKLPLLVLSAASSVITMSVQHGAMERDVPFTVRFSNIIYSYAMYVMKTLWPMHLAAFYPYEGYRLLGWKVFLCALLLAAISYWTWRERAHRYLVVGWLWFLGTMVPMIGLIQVGDQGMADRYAYLPLIGLFVMLVWSADEWAAKRAISSKSRIAAPAILIAVFIGLTWRQIGTWKSSTDLWAHTVAVTEDNYMAENYLGQSLLLANFQQTGERFSEEAAVHFRNAVRLNPGDAGSRLNLGADLHEHGKLQEAVEQYQAVLHLTKDPYFISKALIDLGAAYHQLKEYGKAREAYRAALQIEPGNQIIFMNMGKLAMDERIEQLLAAATAHPSADAYLDLGHLQQSAGHLPEARSSYELALKLNSKLKDAAAALNSLDPKQPQ